MGCSSGLGNYFDDEAAGREGASGRGRSASHPDAATAPQAGHAATQLHRRPTTRASTLDRHVRNSGQGTRWHQTVNCEY